LDIFKVKFYDLKAAPVIEFLIQSYPKYVTVEELPMNTMQDKVIIFQETK
jgi:hypothetical protein